MYARAKLPAFSAWKAVLSGAQGSRLASAALRVFGFGRNPSFWMGAFEEANTLLDRYAQQVFWLHATRLGHTDASVRTFGRTAGAEYWVQRRGPEQPPHERGMDWHFDKDEDLLDQKDVVVMPTVGTVTYLSSVGAPTCRPVAADARWTRFSVANFGQSGHCVPHPSSLRQVAFDGQLLHGCPVALAEAGERLSLVVNIWFEHKPLGVSSSNSKQPAEAEEFFSTATPLRPIDQEVPRSGKKLTVDFGPWRIGGLRIPPADVRAPEGSGLWAIHHPVDQVHIGLPVTSGTRPRRSLGAKRERARFR
eukprot:s2395_g9.t1